MPGVIIDGRIVTETNPQAFAKGDQAHVPYLVGGNSYEASLFPAVIRYPGVVMGRVGGDADRAKSLYGGATPQAAADLTTEAQIIEPNRFLARRMAAAGQPVFLYYFSYLPAAQRGSALGVAHGGEINYVFGNLPAQPVTYAGRSYPAAAPEDRKLGDAVFAYWLAFAKTGDPDSAGGPRWPRYGAEGDQLLEFGSDGITVRQDFHKDRLDWLELVAGAPGR